eukprot:scaffold335712_cov18-Prasinocladus_malaysianus.AAC.1
MGVNNEMRLQVSMCSYATVTVGVRVRRRTYDFAAQAAGAKVQTKPKGASKATDSRRCTRCL